MGAGMVPGASLEERTLELNFRGRGRGNRKPWLGVNIPMGSPIFMAYYLDEWVEGAVH